MDGCINHKDCGTCSERLVCHCLQVTEAELLSVLTARQLRTLQEVRLHTGAGDGCTACHRVLRQYLERIPLPTLEAVPMQAAM